MNLNSNLLLNDWSSKSNLDDIYSYFHFILGSGNVNFVYSCLLKRQIQLTYFFSATFLKFQILSQKKTTLLKLQIERLLKDEDQN